MQHVSQTLLHGHKGRAVDMVKLILDNAEAIESLPKGQIVFHVAGDGQIEVDLIPAKVRLHRRDI